MEELCRIVYKNVVLRGVVGDITELDVEAIVNPANTYMYMGGGLAGYLKRRGGREIEDEARKYAPVPIGKAVATTAGRLKQKYIIHSPTMEKPAGETSIEKIYKATYAALETGCGVGARSIAFPGMGTGVGGIDPMKAVESMFKAIMEVLEKKCSVEEIVVADINREIPQQFCKLLEKYLGS